MMFFKNIFKSTIQIIFYNIILSVSLVAILILINQYYSLKSFAFKHQDTANKIHERFINNDLSSFNYISNIEIEIITSNDIYTLIDNRFVLTNYKIESLDFLNILISPNIFINIPNYTMYHFDNVIIRMNAQHTTFFASIFYVLLIVILVVMNFLFYIIVKKNIISMNNLKISAQEYALSERTMSYLIGILHHKLNTPLKVLATKSRVLIETIINNNIPEYIKEKSEWDYVQIDNSLKTIFNVTSKLKTYNALSQNELNLYKLFTISKETSDILKDDEFEIDIDYKSKMFEINKLHLTSHEIIHIFINQIKCSLVLLADKISIKVLKSDKEYVTILYRDNGNKINKNIFDLLKKQTSIANINRSTTDVDYFDLILNFNIINSNKRSSIKILESEDIGNTFEIKLPIIKKKFKK